MMWDTLVRPDPSMERQTRAKEMEQPPRRHAEDSCLGVKLTPRPRACACSRSRCKMARCAGHGFDDVADGDGSGDRRRTAMTAGFLPSASFASVALLGWSRTAEPSARRQTKSTRKV